MSGVLEGLLARPAKVAEKAATGVGVAMMTHGTPLSSILDSPPKRAATALAAYKWSVYIREAERAIAVKVSTVPWWLEDGNGDRITDESPEPYRAIRDSIERPYAPGEGDPVQASPQTRTDLWNITIRHMGLVGYGFHYLVGIEALAGTPSETLYVSPARITPALDRNGNLIGWVMDASSHPVPFSLEELIPFYLEPPDEGFLPTGLVQTALAKAEIARMGDSHAAYTLASGGRMPGMYHPPAGSSIPEEQFNALTRDIRSIVEMPDAAKRSLVLKGPVEFTQTSQTPSEMQLLDIMAMTRDDIHGLWGVPRSQMGYQRTAVLGGTATDLDAESFFRNGWGPRLMAFMETFQMRILDRYAKLGLPVTMRCDMPTFDDDAPKYAMAQQAQSVPLRNVERRAILGLGPTGDPAIDDAIMLPINMVQLFQAPPSDAGDMEGLAKASIEGDRRVRSLVKALGAFLSEQATRIGGKIERNSGHLARKPKDDDTWWNEGAEDAALLKVLRPHVVDFALVSGVKARKKVTGKASEDDDFRAVLEKLTYDRLARRVVQINKSTRERIRDLVIEGLDAGLSPAEVGRGLRGVVLPLAEDATGNALRQRLGDFGSELRAETIARTEMRVAQNAAAIDSYGTLGVEMVRAIDGDDDPLCAGRDGQEVDLATAEEWAASEHPNGTLDFAPIV